ncbi:Gfo/Idh/MocA family oxidoreductase [Scrofimicrobium sp. R131]|uniref:Gfo/Idh/MocA family oxidoreductase n=1 Tax=Scrofimicrobium appendicitidis TaxID=3079930 RepID=A0AAU7V7U3_9ACTO
MSAPIRLALIGLGGISQSVHLPIITRLHDRVQLVAVVDLSAQRVREIQSAYGEQLAGFTSVDDLLHAVDAGLQVDAVALATTGSHSQAALPLVKRGWPVLVEKPLGYSRGEVAELLPYAAQMRVGYMKEYDPASRRARELVSQVRVRSVEVEVLHPQDQAQLEFAHLRRPANDVSQEALRTVVEPTESALRSALGPEILSDRVGDLDRLYPNVVLGSVVHDIALLRYLVGGIGTVEHAQHYGPEFPGSLRLGGTLREQAVPWQINWHFIAGYPQYRETVTIHHEEGTIQLVFDVPYLLNVATELHEVTATPHYGVNHSVQTWPQQEAFEQEWLDFLALAGNTPRPGSSVAESLEDLRVGQEMIRLLAESKGISLDPEVEASR